MRVSNLVLILEMTDKVFNHIKQKFQGKIYKNDNLGGIKPGTDTVGYLVIFEVIRKIDHVILNYSISHSGGYHKIIWEIGNQLEKYYSVKSKLNMIPWDKLTFEQRFYLHSLSN